MQVDPTPLDELFARWSAELDRVEAQLGPPEAKPPTDAWRAEMRGRTELLRALARELAIVYIERLDANQRRRVQTMIDERRWVRWQFSSVISDQFERALDSLAERELDVALALIAIYDERAASPDFSRLLHPFFVRLQERGVDAAAVFRDRRHFATPHEDPERGAQAVFARCAAAG